ncbi:MAG TPA: response regulator [Anaerolineales bacterium]|nr:response regulator [Anaerolineales bacterium]
MSSHRIMIVEDQREVSRLLRSALDTLEHELSVIEIPSGEEAILDSSRNTVDLLVSDYRLPGISGIELMRKVRQNHPGVKVILITGQTDPKVRREVAEAGADAFFIKPVPMADFLDAVERHLGLVETILPPEPIARDDDEEFQRSLPDLLANLRQELEAAATFLLSDTGRVLARAGDLPDGDDEAALLASLLAIYSAGRKVSHLIGQKVASNWYVFDGGVYDLIFAPVGASHAMLVVGQGLADESRVLKTVDIFSAARKSIQETLGGAAPSAPAAAHEPVGASAEAVEQGGKELEPLFKEAKKKLKPGEADEFWDKAAHKHKAPAKSDMLSYEQAKQLGLAPKDEK